MDGRENKSLRSPIHRDEEGKEEEEGVAPRDIQRGRQCTLRCACRLNVILEPLPVGAISARVRALQTALSTSLSQCVIVAARVCFPFLGQ